MFVKIFKVILNNKILFSNHKVLNAKVKIKENSWMAFIAAKKLGAQQVAFVLGNTIHLHNCSNNEFLNDTQWVKHELCHVQQFKQYGFMNFIFLYCKESIKNGYYNNKYELEAVEAENCETIFWK